MANGIHPHYDFVNNKIKKKHPHLKVKQGIFGLSNKEKNEIEFLDIELNLIKPYYSTDQIKKYFANSTNNEWIIYTDSTFRNPERIKPFPNIKKHLDQFGEVITSDNKPYGLHRARNQDFFCGEKILALRKSADSPQFTYTDFECYVSATFYIIKTPRIDQRFLSLYLNSKVVQFWLKNKGKMQGSNYQLDKEPITNIPIIKSKFEDEIIQLFLKFEQKWLVEGNISKVIGELDSLVYKSFDLSNDEIKSIENNLLS